MIMNKGRDSQVVKGDTLKMYSLVVRGFDFHSRHHIKRGRIAVFRQTHAMGFSPIAQFQSHDFNQINPLEKSEGRRFNFSPLYHFFFPHTKQGKILYRGFVQHLKKMHKGVSVFALYVTTSSQYRMLNSFPCYPTSNGVN